MAGPVLLLTMVVHLVSRTGQGNSRDHKNGIKKTAPVTKPGAIFSLNIEQRSSERLSPSLLGLRHPNDCVSEFLSTVPPGVYGLPDEL